MENKPVEEVLIGKTIARIDKQCEGDDRYERWIIHFTDGTSAELSSEGISYGGELQHSFLLEMLPNPKEASAERD